jgi:hypothetical protein
MDGFAHSKDVMIMVEIRLREFNAATLSMRARFASGVRQRALYSQ